MAKQVTLTLKTLETAVKELEQIKEQISAHAGTAAQRHKQAKDSVLPGLKVPGLQIKKDSPVSEALAAIEAYRATVDQTIDEAITAHLRKSKDDSAEGLTALRETFKSKSEMAQAVQTMLVGLGVDGAAAVSIPTLKGTGRVGTGGSKANTKNQQFYVVRNGVRQDSPTSQNKFSSIAWYFGAEIGVPNCDTNKTKDGFKGCSSKALETFLKSKGIENVSTEDWEYEASETFKVGLEIVTPAGDAG